MILTGIFTRLNGWSEQGSDPQHPKSITEDDKKSLFCDPYCEPALKE